MAQSQRQRKSAKGPNLKPFYIALAVIALGGIGWIGYSIVSAGGGGAPAVEPVELTGLDDPQVLLNAAKGIRAGQADAPVQVLVFSDFTCPACKRWSTAIEPLVKRDLVETGKVRLVYYDFPLGGSGEHRHSFVAGRGARCADEQGKFWEYHDMLFAKQSEWVFSRTAPLEQLGTYAQQVGLDQEAFDRCLKSDRHADVVTANRMLGQSLGVNGTPTIFIGSRALRDWGDYAAVRQAVEREMGPAS